MKLLIKGGRLLDPESRTDEKADVLLEDGVVRAVGKGADGRGAEVLEATGRWVMPGFIDLHVHLREPGEEYKEDIASGSAAAAAGGFTTLVAMPNTYPVIDNSELVDYVKTRGEAVGRCRVLPAGAVTLGQKGETLAAFAEMRRAGALAVTDDGKPVVDANLMRRALEYAQDFSLVVMTHAEEPALSRNGHMHEGEVSTRLGLRGVPGVGEAIAVGRDVALAEYTGGRLHVCHVSTARAVAIIRDAKARGVRVTAEAAPHHFSLTDRAVEGYGTASKMNPPLREESDRLAVVAGLKDGTLDAIATDHAPHSSIEKDVAFDEAANGIIGLQTALPLALELHRVAGLPLLTVVERLTLGPARVLGLPYGRIAAGAPADLVVVDPDRTWTLDAKTNLSKSVNSPWWGKPLTGSPSATILGGQVVYRSSQ